MNLDKSIEGVKNRAWLLFVIWIGITGYYLYQYGFTVSFDDKIQKVLSGIIIGIFVALLYSYGMIMKEHGAKKR
ncbi:hypothetical protein ACFL96_03175 [Thermoproteota archaeon]